MTDLLLQHTEILNQYEVTADSQIVGQIALFTAIQGDSGPWIWLIEAAFHEGRKPLSGLEPTRGRHAGVCQELESRSQTEGADNLASGYAHVSAMPLLAKPSHHFAQDVRTVLEYANLAYLAAAAALGNRHANRRFVHIQSDVCDIVYQARPPCLRLCAGNPAQPSTLCMPMTGRRSPSEHRV